MKRSYVKTRSLSYNVKAVSANTLIEIADPHVHRNITLITILYSINDFNVLNHCSTWCTLQGGNLGLDFANDKFV